MILIHDHDTSTSSTSITIVGMLGFTASLLELYLS